jgi:Lrp/AsnC family transcriptional regulator
MAWADRLCAVIAAIPEVVEFYRMSGNVDYLLRVVVPDIAGYDAVYKRIIREIDIYDVSSSFSMETLKYTTALPVSYAP